MSSTNRKEYKSLDVLENAETGTDPTSISTSQLEFVRTQAAQAVQVLGILLVPAAFLLSFYLGVESSRSVAPSANVCIADPIYELRYQAALASLQILQNDTLESAQESHFINIGPIYDVVDKALDQVGFRRVFLELFETYNFTASTLQAAKDMKKIGKDFGIRTENYSGERPEVVYLNVPSDRFPNETDVCTACLPALHHWVGAIAAEKFLNDGSLLLDAETRERLRTPREVIAELQRMTQEESPPDMVPFHSQHGFLWQYIPAVDTSFYDRYPTDLAIEVCGPLIWDVRENKTYGIIPGLDVIKECIHGMGHAVFYLLAMKQAGRQRKEWTARYQLRVRGGFILTDENLCEADRLCRGAPSPRIYHQCRGGLKHAYYEVSLGHNMSIHSRDVLENTCEHYGPWP